MAKMTKKVSRHDKINRKRKIYDASNCDHEKYFFFVFVHQSPRAKSINYRPIIQWVWYGVTTGVSQIFDKFCPII